MEKYARAYERFEKAFKKFEEIINSNALKEFFKEEFLIEITTKRFEYTYEAMWKACKEFLRIRGIECNSPRSCFREIIKEGIISQEYEEILSRLIILRNELVHVYDEQKAKEIYNEITKSSILELFKAVLSGLKKGQP